MQEVDLSQLDKFILRMDRLSEKKSIRGIFQQVHEEGGTKLQHLVRSKLPYSKKVKFWQVARVGTKGGYTVVQAVSASDGFSSGYDSPGHITNCVENGHAVRPRKSRKSHGYHRRTGRTRVEGVGFYSEARSQSKQIMNEQAKKAEKLLEEKLKELGG